MDLLHKAAIRGILAHVLVLLDTGTDVNLADEDGYTALHLAAMNGHVAVLRLLLTRGADPNARAEGLSPLHLAVIECELADGAEGPVAAVVGLLLGGAEIDAVASNGFTPLFFAAGHGRVDVLELLLANGADVNHATDSGWTALHEAADEDESGEGVRVLLAHGADASAKTAVGETAFDLAGPVARVHLAAVGQA